jgi:hypothetical protein
MFQSAVHPTAAALAAGGLAFAGNQLATRLAMRARPADAMGMRD